MEFVTVEADYRQTPNGWSTVIAAPQLGTKTVQGADLRTVFDAVRDASVDVANRLGRTCRTIHQVGGDPAAFAALAGSEGLPGEQLDSSATVCEPVAAAPARARQARCPYSHSPSR